MYCIINTKTNTLHRVTFSKSLAQLILDSLSDDYKLIDANFVRGRRLKRGEISRGIYGIVATNKDLVLRVPIRQELADIYADDPSRHVEEIFLIKGEAINEVECNVH